MRELSLKERVYPSVLNHHGDVFGGWIMAKMDTACGIAVEKIISSKAVTMAVSNIAFTKPVKNGNILLIYTNIVQIGTSSITIDVDVEVINHITNEEYGVTKAQFIYVAVDELTNAIEVKSVLKNDAAQYIQTMAKT